MNLSQYDCQYQNTYIMTRLLEIHIKVVYTETTRTYYVRRNITIEEFIKEIKRKIMDEVEIKHFELVPLSEGFICAEDGPALESSSDCVSTICNDDYTFFYVRPIARSDHRMARSVTQEERPRCVICLFSERRIAFTSCGHLCICRNCSNNSLITSCPICRNSQTHRIEIFDP